MGNGNSRVDYDFELGKKLFDVSLKQMRRFDGDLLVVYRQETIDVSAGEVTRMRPEFYELDKEKDVPLSSICSLHYYPDGVDAPFPERIGKFENIVSLALSLEEQQRLKAGEVQGDIFNQIALRLEKLYNQPGVRRRKITLSFNEGKRTLVTPHIISLIRRKELPGEIAFLSDLGLVNSSGSRYSDVLGSTF